MATYSTLAEARTAGAVGADADVLSAITEASDAVDRYTHTIFDQRELTVEADVDSDGYVRLPLPALTVTQVQFAGLEGLTGPLDPSAYQLSQASRPGDTDSLQLIGGGFGRFTGLDTVVGLESYRRGDPGLSFTRRRVAVTGTFGRTVTPLPVRRATALIAAAFTGGGATAAVVNTEGDVDLPPRVPNLGDPDAVTTGVAEADALLRHYRRGLVRIS